MELIGKKYFEIPGIRLLTDGKDLYKIKYNKKWISKFVNGEYVSGHYILESRSIEIAETYRTEVKQEYGVNVAYWSSGEVRFKKAQAIAVAMLGPCPKGSCLKFKDSDTKNTAIDNLEYAKRGRPKKAIRKPGDYISFDKSKNKFRWTHPLLPRKQFATKEEAQIKLNEALADTENEDDIDIIDGVYVDQSEILEIQIDEDDEAPCFPAVSSAS